MRSAISWVPKGVSKDVTIKPRDAVILCARTKWVVDLFEDLYLLDVFVFDESDPRNSIMYPHHEIILPALPLCLAWLDCNPQGGEKGNFAAVGMMRDGGTEIWDVDHLIDQGQPVMTLRGSHRAHVHDLAWNKAVRNIIASAGEDKTVKIWDVAREGCLVVTLQHHDNKVLSVAWNTYSPQLLLSASIDRSVALIDMRSKIESARWQFEDSPKSLAWDPYNEHAFILSLENEVKCFDKRAASEPVFTLDAHHEPIISISFCPAAPNFLATGSSDKMVKLWDISNNQPSCVAAQNFEGAFISFSEDDPFSLAVGGGICGLQVWDTLSEPGVLEKFGKYSSSKPKIDPNPNPES